MISLREHTFCQDDIPVGRLCTFLGNSVKCFII